MLYTIPDYYREFACTADKCEDTCCAGWQIMIDEKSLKKYKSVRGDFGKRLRLFVNWKEGAFCQSADKRCAFLNRDNLCDLYQALGKSSLCKTCRDYPRHIEEFENVREITLSVSCPEVASILLEKREPVRFLTYEREGEEEFEEFQPFLYSALADGRESMLQILQNRGVKLQVRMLLILGLAHDMQRRIDKGEYFSCEELFIRYESGQAAEFAGKILKDRKAFPWMIRKRAKSPDVSRRAETASDYESAKSGFRLLRRLERLREDWESYLNETEILLFEGGKEGYDKKHLEFSVWLEQKMPAWEIMLEQLAVYFVFTYFCGAVYDGNAYGKVRFAALGVCLIYETMLARWIKNEGAIDIEDVKEIVYRYSREVEHSDENLRKMGV